MKEWKFFFLYYFFCLNLFHSYKKSYLKHWLYFKMISVGIYSGVRRLSFFCAGAIFLFLDKESLVKYLMPGANTFLKNMKRTFFEPTMILQKLETKKTKGGFHEKYVN